jgi:regulator of RNase E activity RraB
MDQDWTSYFFNADDHPVSVFVNLGIRADVPIPSNPWRLGVQVSLQNPRPDGLTTSEEAPTLFLIEDALNHQIARQCGAITPGRITTRGTRQFWYYAKTNENFRTAVGIAMKGFPGYRFQVAEKQDPEWEYYLNVLYPSREALERIKNRDLLEVLTKQGDILALPREVQHWIYFPSEESRTLFEHEASNVGFRIGHECKSDVQGDSTFGLTVFRTQPIEQERIDETVLELLRLAKRFGGEYDGWETPITTE